MGKISEEANKYGADLLDLAHRAKETGQSRMVAIITARIAGKARMLAPAPEGSRTTTQ
ncbi:MAG: hypothetical protein ABIR33_15755 [Pyrinomonadaceae bacterium]